MIYNAMVMFFVLLSDKLGTAVVKAAIMANKRENVKIIIHVVNRAKQTVCYLFICDGKRLIAQTHYKES